MLERAPRRLILAPLRSLLLQNSRLRCGVWWLANETQGYPVASNTMSTAFAEHRHQHSSQVLDQSPKGLSFVDFPSSWYFFCAARELEKGPVSRRMLGTYLVAYRPDSGRIVVMAGRCAHLGADLGKGKVVGNSIQCPFHGWRYGPDGRCSHIPLGHAIPPQARRRTYPVLERHGIVFVFNGPSPLFPLPFFFDDKAEHFIPAAPVEFVANSTWYMVAAHGYDTQHFETVHSRKLHAPLTVDCPAQYARRSRYTADVVGHAYYDRILRRFAGATVDISITTWGGTMVLITGRFERARSQFLIALQPIENGKTLCRVFPFARISSNPLSRIFLQPINLWIRRLLTGAYLIAEVNSLGNPQYNPTNLIEADREMIDYFRWAAALPSPADWESAKATG